MDPIERLDGLRAASIHEIAKYNWNGIDSCLEYFEEEVREVLNLFIECPEAITDYPKDCYTPLCFDKFKRWKRPCY